MTKGKTKRWSVAVPFTGVIYVEVDADDEESAINAGLNEASLTDKRGHINDAIEWESCRHVVRGNVFYGHTREASAEEVG